MLDRSPLHGFGLALYSSGSAGVDFAAFLRRRLIGREGFASFSASACPFPFPSYDGPPSTPFNAARIAPLSVPERRTELGQRPLIVTDTS